MEMEQVQAQSQHMILSQAPTLSSQAPKLSLQSMSFRSTQAIKSEQGMDNTGNSSASSSVIDTDYTTCPICTKRVCPGTRQHDWDDYDECKLCFHLKTGCKATDRNKQKQIDRFARMKKQQQQEAQSLATARRLSMSQGGTPTVTPQQQQQTQAQTAGAETVDSARNQTQLLDTATVSEDSENDILIGDISMAREGSPAPATRDCPFCGVKYGNPVQICSIDKPLCVFPTEAEINAPTNNNSNNSWELGYCKSCHHSEKLYISHFYSKTIDRGVTLAVNSNPYAPYATCCCGLRICHGGNCFVKTRAKQCRQCLHPNKVCELSYCVACTFVFCVCVFGFDLC